MPISKAIGRSAASRLLIGFRVKPIAVERNASAHSARPVRSSFSRGLLIGLAIVTPFWIVVIWAIYRLV